MPPSESFLKCECQHCGGHIEFPSHAAGQKICCPHCDKPTLLFLTETPPKGKSPVLAAVVGVLLASAGVGAYFYFNSSKARESAAPPILPSGLSNPGSVVAPPKPKPPTDPWKGLKSSQVTLEKTGDGRLVYAIGTLTNTTTRQRFGVKITLDVLDEHRNKIGAAIDYIDVIEPGKLWKFRALVTDENARGATLNNVKEQE